MFSVRAPLTPVIRSDTVLPVAKRTTGIIQKQRQVRFSDGEWTAAGALAREDKRSISGLLRWLIEEEIKRRARRKN